MIEQHRLLKRQLDKLGLSNVQLPKEKSQWEEFIGLVNKTYYEADQERYLLERSMEVSSDEMMTANAQLEYAQDLARLCYWNYNPATSLIIWSKGIYELLGLLHLKPTPNFHELLQLVHPEDRSQLTKNIKSALSEKKNFDFEIQAKAQKGKYKWFRIIIRSNEKNNELSGILMDINTIKESEQEIKELNRTLVSTARLAGMSEVATTILHNVGNLLNSTIVSLDVLKQSLVTPHHQKLDSLVHLLQQNSHHLTEYISNDQKGKLIIPYLAKLAEVTESEFNQNNEEISRLEKNVNHIKEIVAMQQSISGVSGITEKITVSELLNNAIEMSNIHHLNIELTTEVDKAIPAIVSDKSKLLQILTNLLRNAKDSVDTNPEDKSKEISIKVNKLNGKKIVFKVKDNGIGIPKEIHEKIFSFGFTTKEKGHGFGLHSAALSARELGGSLVVQSNGENQGAEFSLTLPINSSVGVKL